MRAACRANATVQQRPLLFEFTRKTFHDPFPLPFVKQDVAMFLLVRGLYAWIGYSWMGCNTGEVAEFLRPEEVEVDYGVPLDTTRTTQQGHRGKRRGGGEGGRWARRRRWTRRRRPCFGNESGGQ